MGGSHNLIGKQYNELFNLRLKSMEFLYLGTIHSAIPKTTADFPISFPEKRFGPKYKPVF
jgi:hypothetical protein